MKILKSIIVACTIATSVMSVFAADSPYKSDKEAKKAQIQSERELSKRDREEAQRFKKMERERHKERKKIESGGRKLRVDM